MAALLGILGVVLARKIVGLGPWHQAGIGLALGGTMGNLIDRLRLGSVIDFIDFSFWPTFNLADSAICVGAGILIILLLKSESSEKTGEMPSPQEPGPGADAFPAAPLENPGE
jgi:signal peptidase II